MPDRRPVAVDLFAGAGGLSLGLEQAGFDVLVSVEYDAVHAATHAFNFPLTEVLTRSVADVTADDIRQAAARAHRRHSPSTAWDGELDLVAGGPPCQGFSWIGKRQVDDARNDLIFHFWRLIHELRPRYFVMENVPGMLSGTHRALLDDLLSRFSDDGYKVEEPTVLQAAHYGVPQSRRRLILIGTRQDQAPAAHPAPITRPAAGPVSRTFERLPQGPTVADAVQDLPNLDDYAELLTADELRLPAHVLRAARRGASEYAKRMAGVVADPHDLSYSRRWDAQRLTSSLRTVHTPRSIARFSATTPGSVEAVSRFLRLNPEGLCNTLRAGTGSERGAHTSPRPIHPQYPRVISVREAARLHSFPDWFRLHVTKWHGFRQVGNAVPPLLGRAIGQSIVEALDLNLEKPDRVIEMGPTSLLKMTMAESGRYFEVPREALPKQRTRKVVSAVALADTGDVRN